MLFRSRKGLETLIRAFLGIKAEGQLAQHKLLLVGERGWKDSPIIELVGSSEWIVSLGYVDDMSLSGLYNGASAFIYPSTYEGFGMPVLEARACGARVVLHWLLPCTSARESSLDGHRTRRSDRHRLRVIDSP